MDEIPVLVVPIGKTVLVDEHSLDVIHSFWVPQFLFKRDVFPYGTRALAATTSSSSPRRTSGSYVGRCAELCGVYHSR